MTAELIFTLVLFALTCWALRLLGKSIDLNRAMLARNAKLISAIEYRDEVIANLQEEIEIDVECDCVRCVERERWLVN